MINLTREEAQQVLGALKETWYHVGTLAPTEQAVYSYEKAIELLRAKLSEPEPHQDWMERERAVGYREGHQAALKQRKWVGLTDEEIVKVFDYIDFKNGWLMHFYRAIEAKLKEKNT